MIIVLENLCSQYVVSPVLFATDGPIGKRMPIALRGAYGSKAPSDKVDTEHSQPYDTTTIRKNMKYGEEK